MSKKDQGGERSNKHGEERATRRVEMKKALKDASLASRSFAGHYHII